uniref:Glycosyltransferases n=1 Tax=Oryza glumipatula TaxID=40148 RepID=A0A0D9ZSG0_9ORYZ
MGDEEEEGSGSRRMLIVVTTTRSDGGVRQRRNAALTHVEKHRLFGVVHFAHTGGVYDAYFFDEIRQIERCHGRSVKSKEIKLLLPPFHDGNDPAAVGSQEIAVPYRYTRYSSTCSRRKLGHGDVEEDEAEPSSDYRLV